MNSDDLKMKREEIRLLLDRYYNGESSEEEELLLKNFLGRNNVPEEFAGDKKIFDCYEDLSCVPEPSQDFERRIISAVEAADGYKTNPGRRKLYIILSGIAACMLILAGTYFFLNRGAGPRDTFSDPEIAYAETLKILHSVSEGLNKGTRPLGRIGSMQDMTVKSLNTLNKSTSEIFEKLKPLNDLSKTLIQQDKTNNIK